MMTSTAQLRPSISLLESADDGALVAALRAGDAAAFEVIMRRHNRLLFRTARAILQDEAEAEDVVQEAYLKAYLNLDGFAGRARLSTWLTKIAVNESLARLRRRMPGGPPDEVKEAIMTAESAGGTMAQSPEAVAAQGELRRLLEAAIDSLPPAQRSVFMLRAVEEFSTEDTAECLGIPAETVKTRLHRARQRLRRSLNRRVANVLNDTFPFAGARCDRVVTGVLSRLPPMPPDG